MRAWVARIPSCGGSSYMTSHITNEYKSLTTLLKYGAPAAGTWELHIHNSWDNKHAPADIVLRVKDGQVIDEVHPFPGEMLSPDLLEYAIGLFNSDAFQSGSMEISDMLPLMLREGITERYARLILDEASMEYFCG